MRGCWLNVSKLCSWHCEIQLVQAFEQVRTHLRGQGSFTSTASSGIELSCICCFLIHHRFRLHYTYRPCTVFRLLKPYPHSNILAEKGKKKNNTPRKRFHLKCSWKCLIQLCTHLDSPVIHLCKFGERQTAESFWYHVRFWASPCPCLREEKGREDREVERVVSRDKPEYSTIRSGVCLCMCVCFHIQAICLLQKAFNRAFISPSVMHTNVLKKPSMIQYCVFKPGEG